MVLPIAIGSTLLRVPRLHLPQTFRRYKSLTQSIERGRQGGPDRPSRFRTRSPPEDAGDARRKTRRELRFDRFGPAADDGSTPRTTRDERPPRDRDERVNTPRSSRFGRVGPPRPRSDAPSRFVEDRPPKDREERPQRRDDGFERSSDGGASRGDRFSSDRRDRQPPRERYGGSGDRPQQGRSFDRDQRSKFSERRPWDARGAKPFERNDKFEGTRVGATGSAFRSNDRRYDSQRNGDERYAAQRNSEGRYDAQEGRSERQDRPRRERSEPMRSRESFSRHSEAPPRATATADGSQNLVREPESLPYATAASEFIYGYSSVLAAMKANRRKLYKLYVHSRGASRDGLLARIRALKLFPITQEVGDEYLRAMDKASSGRPHNGVILESSPLPVPPVTELRAPSMEDESFSVALDSQSAEDALVNGKQELYSYKSAGWRHPLILYVDGVLDEGNLGAIARSAYFLGVDAIVTPTRHVAPWSHIALKASAGAAEAIPVFKVGEATDFLGKSSRAGWRIYASNAVPTAPSLTPEAQEETSSNIVYTFARSTKRLPADHCPVADHPTILMMGAEGTGLRSGLLNLAHYNVGIRHGRDVDEIGVDSLNVSVAASLLCYEMLQKPKSTPAHKAEDALF